MIMMIRDELAKVSLNNLHEKFNAFHKYPYERIFIDDSNLLDFQFVDDINIVALGERKITVIDQYTCQIIHFINNTPSLYRLNLMGGFDIYNMPLVLNEGSVIDLYDVTDSGMSGNV